MAGLRKEIIVVDDGSSDGTYDAALAAIDALASSVYGHVLRFNQNRGKGLAVREGFEKSSGDLVIVQDADLEYDPDDFALLLEPILKGRADVVMGSRFIGGSPRRVVYLSNALGNRLMSVLFSVLSGLRLTDIHCCYMIFPGDLIRGSVPLMSSARWGFNPEICSLLADWRKQLSIVEMGISYYGRSKEEGKKIRLRHGLVAIGEIVRFNVRPARVMPQFQRVSNSGRESAGT